MYIAKIVLLKESNLFIPAMRCHEYKCKTGKDKCTCAKEDVRCKHLSSPKREEAVFLARDLAKRAGVRSEC